MAILPATAARCYVVGRCDAVGATAARMCHRRWQTMHNRWWSDSATCGERIPHYHSASKMSNNVVPLRGTLLLVPPLRRLRPCGLASGYAWSSTFGAFYKMTMCWVCNRAAVVDGGCIRLSPHSRLRRQYGVIHNVTARAVNVAGNQIIIDGI